MNLSKRLMRCVPGERCLLQGCQTEGHASRGHQLPNIWSFEPGSSTQVGNSGTHHSVSFPIPQGPSECFCDVDMVSFLMGTCGYSLVCTLLTRTFLVLWPLVHCQLLVYFLNKPLNGTILFTYRMRPPCRVRGEEQTCT